MKKTQALLLKQAVLLFSFFSLFFLNACKKDQLQSVQTELQIERFLRLPHSATPAVKRVIDDLRRQLQAKNFAVEFEQQNGLPVWDMAMERKVSEGGFILYIPTVKERTEYVASYIMVVFKDGKLYYKLFSKNNEGGLKQNNSTRKSNAAYIFAKLENKIFGKTIIAANSLPISVLAKSTKGNANKAGIVFGKFKHGATKANDNEATEMATGTGNGFSVENDEDWEDDCCIEIWMNPDGDPGNNNGDEYYLHDDCSDCEDEVNDTIIGGVGGGCPWYNPLCDAFGGGTSGYEAPIVAQLNSILQPGESYYFTNDIPPNAPFFHNVNDLRNYIDNSSIPNFIDVPSGT
jgi:hypothetical protein